MKRYMKTVENMKLRSTTWDRDWRLMLYGTTKYPSMRDADALIKAFEKQARLAS